ncbi:uncharacterized protein RCC_00809 [Ramularia collo-cygni]|uniref:Uncharacterized protein n=1 Tax=Ramularia collo-cygni TaxID=112498 RepID=A0A2D3UM63_9PEZI|nr:uncharacterized protein RCC_00809 [Ramularia collo-cygni]CZT14871.1 uncharacterized protein RCC_00809 [Ramularia collo-cygni]
MDASLRNTEALKSRIDYLQNNLARRFENLISLATIQRGDRADSAVTQYSMKTETAGLIRAAEEIQTLIRQMQEMWLFGRLSTLEDSKAKAEVDETAKEVAELVRKLTEASETPDNVESDAKDVEMEI